MTTFLTVGRLVSGLALAGMSTLAMADAFTLTYQNPGVQNTTATFSSSGVENFNSRPAGAGQTFPSTFGGSPFSGTYTGVQILPADIYGGAGGTGMYPVAFGDSPYTVTLASPVNYFGYWLSSMDSHNQVTFYNGVTEVGTFNAGATIAPLLAGNPAYYGNPNPPFLGADPLGLNAFVNFYDTSGFFDRIVFSQLPGGGGYESDNHTVGLYETIGGNVVPEPASWGLLLLGLLGIGGLLKTKPSRPQEMA